MFDVEHVEICAEGEGEDWCWVVVGFDVMGVEHCSGVVDVFKELVVDAGLGFEEVEGGQCCCGERWGGGGGADVGGGVVSCCSDILRGSEDYASGASETFDEGGGHDEIWVVEIEVVCCASSLVA